MRTPEEIYCEATKVDDLNHIITFCAGVRLAVREAVEEAASLLERNEGRVSVRRTAAQEIRDHFKKAGY